MNIDPKITNIDEILGAFDRALMGYGEAGENLSDRMAETNATDFEVDTIAANPDPEAPEGSFVFAIKGVQDTERPHSGDRIKGIATLEDGELVIIEADRDYEGENS
jgi:hypothetical protein